MQMASAKVTVDRELCFGHGRCYALAPRVYSEDEGGYCLISREVVDGAELVEEALIGQTNCPENAIEVTLIDESTLEDHPDEA